jgi:hypothetical protein
VIGPNVPTQSHPASRPATWRTNSIGEVNATIP